GEEILTQDGELVRAGQALVRLDPTLLRANLDIYRNRLADAMSKRERLEAEQRGLDTLVFKDTSDLVGEAELQRRRAGQMELFESRSAVLKGRREQLTEKVAQYRNQITGVDGLISSKKDQLGFIDRELSSMKTLSDKGLARESQVLALQRSRADLLGQIAEHQSELARIANSIRDTELEMLQGDYQFRQEAVEQLSTVTTETEELVQQILSTEKQLDRVEIRAPVDGVVHELQVVTIGGVVSPGQTILQIVPSDQGIEFETRVDPISIDQVFVGQEAKVMMSALNQRTTPELQGSVKWMSPTSVMDEATGLTFFRVQVLISGEELARLGDVELVPGMPVDAFLQTAERSVMSYLTRPLNDHLSRAFLEE
ncbi:MAG: HlyD family type I secretion periplasmic adaptor subunit, partial [Paracoccaceae bacterium]